MLYCTVIDAYFHICLRPPVSRVLAHPAQTDPSQCIQAGEACQDPIGLSIYANLLGIANDKAHCNFVTNLCSDSGTS